MDRVVASNSWDPYTNPFRLNIKGMLAQRLAADDEAAKRSAQRGALPERSHPSGMSTEGEEILGDYSNDDVNINVIPSSIQRTNIIIFVKEAFRSFLKDGFGKDDSAAPSSSSSPLLSGRTHAEAERDLARVVGGPGIPSVKLAMDRQESDLENMTTSRASSLSASTPQPLPSAPLPLSPSDATILQPYLINLRNASNMGASESVRCDRDAKRRSTNDAVANTDVGAASRLQHSVAFSIAQEFGLNRKQRLAFYIFVNGLLAQNSSSPPEALRLYIGGGELLDRSILPF